MTKNVRYLTFLGKLRIFEELAEAPTHTMAMGNALNTSDCAGPTYSGSLQSRRPANGRCTAIHDELHGDGGFVSIEVPPYLAWKPKARSLRSSGSGKRVAHELMAMGRATQEGLRVTISDEA